MKNQTADGPRVSDGHDIRLSLDAWGRLVLSTDDGQQYVGVDPVRAFPISDPTSWVSFTDEHGREVFCLRTLDGLSAESRAFLERELSLRDFVPVIRRIVRVSGDSTPCDWEVETDHGRTRFTLDNEDDVRLLGPHRVMIGDSRKLRYQIPDTRSLDGHSRRLLDRYI
ncbi:MAG: DUF1854 domain-containing protein [Planctomycetia bacterium]|nr:DUF1854 domain-containing protein [Planctomycetia bacterium]